MVETVNDVLSLLKQMLRLGEFDQALTLMQSLLSDEDVDVESRLRAIKIGCQILLLKGMLEESQAIATKSLERARKIGNPLLLIDFKLILAEIMLNKKELIQAQSMVDSAWELMENIRNDFPQDDVGKREAMIEILEGDVHFSNDLIKESLSFYNKAMKISMDIKDPSLIGKALLRIGKIYARENETEKALYYLNQALVLIGAHGDPLDTIECLGQLAVAHSRLGNFEKAISFHQDRLSFLADAGNSREMAASLAEVSWLYQQVGKLDSAVKYCQRSLEMYEQMNDHANEAYCHLDMAIILRKKGEWEEALNHTHHAMAVFTEINDRRELIQASLHIAQIYRQKNDLIRAVDQYEQVLELLRERRYLVEYLLEDLYWLIIIYLTLNDLEQAKILYQQLKIVSSSQSNEIPVEHVKKLLSAIIYKETTANKLLLEKAKEKFKVLMKEEPLSTAYILRAFVHYCDLLIKSALLESERRTNEQFLEILYEINEMIDRIIIMYLDLNEDFMAIEFMMMRAQLLSALQQHGDALELLSKAMFIAKNNGINKIISKITLGADEILEQLIIKKLESSNEDSRFLTVFKKLHEHMKYLILEVVGYEEFPLPSQSKESMFFLGGTSGFPLYLKMLDDQSDLDWKVISRKLCSYISLNADKILSSKRNIDLGEINGRKYLIRLEDGLALGVIFKGPMYFPWRKIEDLLLLLKKRQDIWNKLKKKAREGKFLNEEETKLVSSLIEQSDFWS